jgi:hypothetical protein
MKMTNIPLFEAPLAHMVAEHTNLCECPACRPNSVLEHNWAGREWETAVGPNPRVNTPLPRSGPGFISSAPTNRQFGLPETIQALQSIGAAWQRAHPNGPVINIRDISFQGGGPMPGHKSHRLGVDMDIRPMRNDGKQGPVTFRSPTYSRALTQELVRFIRANGILRVQYIFFNDPAIQDVQPWPNHDDHLHVRFFPPRGTSPTPTPPSPSTRRPVLRRGSRGGAVGDLQARLNMWLMAQGAQSGLGKLAVDGVFGSRTQDVVRAYQQAQGLRADGVVGSQTWARLLQSRPSPLPRPPLPTPQPPLPPSPSAVPALIEPPLHQLPEATLFVDIRLGSEGRARPMTGIFIPENYHTMPSVDLILYLHGFKTPKIRATPANPHPVQRPDPGWSINQYWRQHWYAFREGVNDGHKNVILVTPTLGQFSETGSLTRPGGFDRYIDQVMAALIAYGPYVGQSPRVGNIILACHSGGGYPMRVLALSSQRYTPLIRECWGFDCTYNRGDDTEWARWARQHPSAKLYIYYRLKSDTALYSKPLQDQNLPNVTVVSVEPQRVKHEEVPITYWSTRIREASFLLNR